MGSVLAEEFRKPVLMDGMGEGKDDDFYKRYKNKDKLAVYQTKIA